MRDMPTKGDMRRYVARRLSEMASDGSLFLTDCLNQPGTKGQRDVLSVFVGDVIMGYDVGPDGFQRQGRPVPRALLDFRVKVRSINCRSQVDEERPDSLQIVSKHVVSKKTIGWKDMPEVVGEAVDFDYARATQATHVEGSEMFDMDGAYRDTGELETELSVRDALLCLRQRGKYVKPARSRRLQQFYWQVEEVRPGEETKQEDEPPKKKRIRRTKAQIAADNATAEAARVADKKAEEGPVASA